MDIKKLWFLCNNGRRHIDQTKLQQICEMESLEHNL